MLSNSPPPPNIYIYIFFLLRASSSLYPTGYTASDNKIEGENKNKK